MGPLTHNVQQIVMQIDKDEPVYEVTLLDTFVNHSLKTRRFVVFLVTLFGAAGALLSALGLYGLLSYSIAIGVASSASGWRWAQPAGRLPRWFASAISSRDDGSARAAWAPSRSPLYRQSALGVGFGESITWLALQAHRVWPAVLACICRRGDRADQFDGSLAESGLKRTSVNFGTPMPEAAITEFWKELKRSEGFSVGRASEATRTTRRAAMSGPVWCRFRDGLLQAAVVSPGQNKWCDILMAKERRPGESPLSSAEVFAYTISGKWGLPGA